MYKYYDIIKKRCTCISNVVNFNVENLSIGRISQTISILLRKMEYSNSIKNVLIINADKISMKYPKKYIFKHTNSKFGNMRKFTFQDIYMRQKLYMIRRVTKSMLPSNTTSLKLLKKIYVDNR